MRRSWELFISLYQNHKADPSSAKPSLQDIHRFIMDEPYAVFDEEFRWGLALAGGIYDVSCAGFPVSGYLRPFHKLAWQIFHIRFGNARESASLSLPIDDPLYTQHRSEINELIECEAPYGVGVIVTPCPVSRTVCYRLDRMRRVGGYFSNTQSIEDTARLLCPASWAKYKHYAKFVGRSDPSLPITPDGVDSARRGKRIINMED